MRFPGLGFVVVALAACPAPEPPVAPKPPPPPVAVVTPPPPVVTPVPPGDDTPKLRLPRLFTPTSYVARLALDPAKPTFDGQITITGEVSTATSVIWLHGHELAIKKATAASGGTSVEVHVTPRGDELLELQTDAPLAPGSYQLALDYTGQVDTLNTTGAFVETTGGVPYLFSQFEAVYARRVFPCLDEPDSKVPWQLTLDVPKGQLAVANTPVAKESEAGAHHVFEFAPTKPLPPYLIAFGVGPFEVVPAGATKSGIPVRIITFKGRGGEAAYAAKSTARVLDLLEAWFQIPYPYAKLDILTIPVTAGFGAMENAGLVTAAQSYVLLGAKPSWERRATWISGAAHELAHQWFGDFVTTAWWDDIWLNEGFANWMENKITAQFEPAWHFELHEQTMRREALDADSLTKARRIRQPIATSDDIFNVFDGITYDKGGSILNMFERYVGADVFQRGVREYLKSRAYSNATSADFIASISKAAGKELGPAFSSFLDQAGAPELEATLACTGGPPRLELAQRRYIPAGAAASEAAKPWKVPVCVAFDQDGKRGEACALLEEATATLALPAKSCPRWVLPNVDGRGYYRVHYTAPQVAALRDEAWPVLAWTERRALFADVAAESRSARPGFHDDKPHKLPVMLALSLVPKLLTGGDRYTIADVLEVPIDLEKAVADDQRGKLEAWYRMTFGPGATKLGMLPKDSDDYDAEEARVSVVLAAAWRGRDPELVKQAKELAGHWRDLPEAMREPILRIAIDGDPDLVAKAIAELRAEKKHDTRAELIDALAKQRDPKGYAAALEVTLDPALDLRETRRILKTRSEANRALAEAFFRAHGDEIMKRLPADEVASVLADVVHVFTNACDAKRRDEIVKEITTRFADRPGAAHVLAVATEGLDQCIASRTALEPEVRGWLGGVKLPPKPKADAKAEAKPKPRASKH